ncbi:DUF1214 domain-containing protein [Shimia thalassica]|uniref:DUF1214 domain-containing protein n=1 Tax=Shimia thalassica TaxID=1715693 RepID=UPI0026E43C05|nr:DUF1254 domain-containing protein [Shimia thalassica]MDO6797960.1 DUF1214 domain-containing protein [Shimia thalassica]
MLKKLLIASLLIPTIATAQKVNVQNYVRAESDTMIRASLTSVGQTSVGELNHLREPTTPDNQPVIRMNQDTLYSAVVVDLSTPVTVELPNVDGRYMSMHVVNQDHFMSFETKPGVYELTEEVVGTRFALVTFRTFVDPNDPKDIERAHAAQDAINITGGGSGAFKAPDWDQGTLTKARKLISDLATLGFESTYAFGTEEETQPIDHLLGAASGWGGLPREAAFYVLGAEDQNDGVATYTVTVKDVPVDGFWSITVYNADGYLEPNELGVNSLNNVTANRDPAGVYTIHFGGCEGDRDNCIPISQGWNYVIRMYTPRAEILDSSWVFPKLVKQE